MNFSEFQIWRTQSQRENPGALDCAETNLYRSLAALRPKPSAANTDRKIHRCDLARAWLNRYEFHADNSRRALVCQGVRHALGLIFAEVASSGAALWLPRDVYPVYMELAHAAGIKPHLFRTLPQPHFPQHQDTGQAEFLLIANPLKPLGRFLSEQECAGLKNWLAASPNRQLIVDCVYDLGVPFHPSTRTLAETGQAILLHSVTKGWLWPKTFGVALIGRGHLQLEITFRNAPPTQEQLALAEIFFSVEVKLPTKIMSVLNQRKEKLLAALPSAVIESFVLESSSLAPGCYFFPIKIQTDLLLHQHQIIGIPASAFGADWNGSILTSLADNFAVDNEGGQP